MEKVIKTIEECPSSIFTKDDILAILKKNDDYSVSIPFKYHFLPLVEHLGFRHVYEDDRYVAKVNQTQGFRLTQLMECTIKTQNDYLEDGMFFTWKSGNYEFDISEVRYSCFNIIEAYVEARIIQAIINKQIEIGSKLEECFTKLYSDGLGDIKFSGSVSKEIRANSDGDEINVTISVDQDNCDLDDLDLSTFQQLLDEKLSSLFE